jgi:hypothetical protein
MTEPNPGPLFKTPLPKSELDADAVIRASRRRRAPRIVAVVAASVLVVGGVIGGVGILLPHPADSTSAAASAGPHPALPAKGATIHSITPGVNGLCQAASGVAGDKVLCGCGTASLPPQSTDLVGQLAYPAESEGSRTDGTLTITNNSSATITGTADTPVPFIVTQGIIVSPIGADDSAGHSIDLAPGASTTLAVPFPGLNCANGNAPAGSYQIGAFIDIALSNGTHVGVVASNSSVVVSK